MLCSGGGGGRWLSDDRDESERGTSKNEKIAASQEGVAEVSKAADGTDAAGEAAQAGSSVAAQLVEGERFTPVSAKDTRNVATTTTSTATQPGSDAAQPVISQPPPANASSTTLVVPPLNFSMVSRGIYRSGHPNERNFEFLRRLNLKSVLYLGTEDYRSNMTSWTASQNIQTFHLRLAINKEPTAEMDEADVVKALQLILTPDNWPILIHCNKGKYRVGCIVGLFRRLQGWSHTSIFEEYSRFAGTKISDLEFIEVFDLDKVSLAS